MNRRLCILLAGIFLLSGGPLPGQQRTLRPGFNLFTKDQDVQLGKEAAAQIEKEVELVNHPQILNYVRFLGQKLASQPEADKYPYSFRVVNDRSVNAFALPGGPVFVHTGLLAAVDNDAQLAGVLAHEIAHVALRHGTNQVTKANLIQLPVLLASSAIGNQSLLAQLGQLGIGLGANSLLLKFSRTAEEEADILGARIMHRAGYDPMEMVRFFEKLETEKGSRLIQFFSTHPNPGNRRVVVQKELQYLPRRSYFSDSGSLKTIKAIVATLPQPQKTLSGSAQADRPSR